MADEIDRFLEGYTPDIRDLTHQVRALIASITGSKRARWTAC